MCHDIHDINDVDDKYKVVEHITDGLLIIERSYNKRPLLSSSHDAKNGQEKSFTDANR
jgi:hypothetical protein